MALLLVGPADCGRSTASAPANARPAARADSSDAGVPEVPSPGGPARFQLSRSPGSSNAGQVMMEAPLVDGPLAHVIVEREIRVRLGGVKACYERSLRDHPKLAGRLKLRWTIGLVGKTVDVVIADDTLGDAFVTGCVAGLVARWRFPAPDLKVRVVAAFVFSPKNSDGVRDLGAP